MFCNIGSTFKLSTFAKKICKALIGTCIICIYINIIMITEIFCRKYSIQHVQSEFSFFGLRKGKNVYI